MSRWPYTPSSVPTKGCCRVCTVHVLACRAPALCTSTCQPENACAAFRRHQQRPAGTTGNLSLLSVCHNLGCRIAAEDGVSFPGSQCLLRVLRVVSCALSCTGSKFNQSSTHISSRVHFDSKSTQVHKQHHQTIQTGPPQESGPVTPSASKLILPRLGVDGPTAWASFGGCQAYMRPEH